MPYSVRPNAYPASVPLPQGLSHVPFYALPYEHFDGIYKGATDTHYLSVGLAQYDSAKVSAKVMRHTGGQWSPQAEELPLHRPIDLTIFLAKALFDSNQGVVEIRGGTFESQENMIQITQETRSAAETKQFQSFLSSNSIPIKARLNSLCDVLMDLRNRGKI